MNVSYTLNIKGITKDVAVRYFEMYNSWGSQIFSDCTLQIKIVAIFSIAKDKNKRFASSIFFAKILIKKWKKYKVERKKRE